MTDRYILNDKSPVACPDLMTWARWFESAERHVALTQIFDHRVSTVFLGMDHRFGGEREPILFETMTFDKKGNEVDCERSCTWEQAESIHNKAVGKITQANLPTVKYPHKRI